MGGAYEEGGGGDGDADEEGADHERLAGVGPRLEAGKEARGGL